MQLSPRFQLSDFTKTSTGYSNDPSPSAIQNLTDLAEFLEKVYDQIGPFTVSSAYRSPEVNRAVGGSDTSLHTKGQAADLIPLTMSPKEFFKRLAQSPLKDEAGEIIDEADEKGVVHVTTPTWTMTGALKYLANGSYFRYTADQIAALVGEAVDTGSDLIEDNKSTVMVTLGLALVAGGLFYVLQNRRLAK